MTVLREKLCLSSVFTLSPSTQPHHRHRPIHSTAINSPEAEDPRYFIIWFTGYAMVAVADRGDGGWISITINHYYDVRSSGLSYFYRPIKYRRRRQDAWIQSRIFPQTAAVMIFR